MRYSILAAIILFSTGCAASQHSPNPNLSWPEYSGPTPVVKKQIDKIGPLTWDQKLKIHDGIDEIAFTILRMKYPAPLKEGKREMEKGFIIKLYDKDSDGIVDTYMHLQAGQQSSLDFGFVFDLNNDGKMDYIVFNGGPFPTKEMKTGWMNYHMIDSNYDGKIDMLVYNVDLDDDKSLDTDAWAWLYDNDFDGCIDSGEYLGPTVKKPIQEVDGFLIIKGATGEKRFSKKDSKNTVEFLSGILSEINRLISQ